MKTKLYNLLVNIALYFLMFGFPIYILFSIIKRNFIMLVFIIISFILLCKIYSCFLIEKRINECFIINKKDKINMAPNYIFYYNIFLQKKGKKYFAEKCKEMIYYLEPNRQYIIETHELIKKKLEKMQKKGEIEIIELRKLGKRPIIEKLFLFNFKEILKRKQFYLIKIRKNYPAQTA